MQALDIKEAYSAPFEYNGISHLVCCDGTGPGVLLLHELPGMTPKFLELAARIKKAGFTVYMPLLFGDPGQDSGFRGSMGVLRLCVRREAYCLAQQRSSPLTNWLRQLCRRIHGECHGNGVGVIGMCFTGSFVLSVMLEPSVMVPVMSQPALPFSPLVPCVGAKQKAALGISGSELVSAIKRSAEAPILGYRFTTDKICPAERFQSLRWHFGSNFQATEIPTGKGNPGNFSSRAHAVLTEEFVDEPGHPTFLALQEILENLKKRL